MKAKAGKTGKAKYASGGKVSNFGQAFRDAKKGGAKEFTFGGKKYTTDTREDDYKKKLAASTKANQAVASTSLAKGQKERENYGREVDNTNRLMREAGKGITPVAKPKSAADANYDKELAKSTAAMRAVGSPTKYKKGGTVKKRRKYI